MYYIYMRNTSDNVRRTVYSPDKVSEGYSVTAAKVTNEVDKAGEVSFTISVKHPLYKEFRKLVTLIEVIQDDRVIWFGRVFGIRRDFYMNKTITCEGALSFLEDICLMPYHYYEQQMITTANGAEQAYVMVRKSKWDHLNYILDVYNYRCHPSRRISLGSNITDELCTYNEINGTDSYNNVLKEIQDKIIEDYDYSIVSTFFKDPDTDNTTTYMNLVRLPFGECTQTIEFGKNLIDFEEFVDASAVYSTIIPVGSGNISIFNDNGKDEESLVPLKDRIYYINRATEAFDGMIDKVVEFNNIDDRDELYTAGQTVLDCGGGMSAVNFTINAIDLHLLDVNTESINIGENIRVISAPHGVDVKVVAYKIELDLLDPENSKYTFRTPDRMSPETLTEHLYSTIAGVQKRLNQKLTVNQSYGVLSMSPEASALTLIMPEEE